MAESAKSGEGEPDTKEVEALAGALNHSAERVQTLWFSFLTFMVYLAIATGTTTHRMLFLESPLNLPVLNISLPLLGFYILTPIIFVIFHFYMLLNLVLLARTAKSFEDALERAFPQDGEARETFRMRIENTLFVQLLVGGRLEREGINAKLLSLMALITLAVAPVALLLMIQIKFLPYHSEWITWLHRGLLALDLVLVWTLWPGYRSGWGARLWPKRSWWLMLPGIGSAAALAYAAMVATFPDEHMYLATNWLHGIAPLNTLKLHGEDLIDDTKLAHILKKNESSSDEPRWVASFSVSDRDLTGADLGDADVRQVDFSGAILNRVKLDRAWADNAHFVYSDLQGASIWAAQLRGALLDHSKLQGASLNLAQLQGASLVEAQLQGASLDSVGLQGGSLDDAQLQGASLDDVHLQAASLDSAGLQGASLDHAQLHGATLDSAGLQGASLVGAKLQGTSFRNVFVWRADGGAANWKDTRVAGVNIGPKKRCYEPGPPPIGYDKDKVCNWTADTFEDLKRLIAKQIPEGYRREAAMKRIEERLDPGKNLPGEEEMAKIWTDHSPTPVVHKTYAEAMRAIASASEDYENSLAEQWHEIGCADEGAPYVLRALLRRLDDRDISPFASISPERAKLAADFLDESHCLGAHGLSEADRAKLKKIAATGTPPAPKP